MLTLQPSQSLDEFLKMIDCFVRADQYSQSLSARLQLVLLEDNRVGVLNGIDGKDNTLAPTKYRYSSGGVVKNGPHGMLRTKQVTNPQTNTARIFFNYSEIPRDHESYAAQTNLRVQSMPVFYTGYYAVGSYRSQFYNPSNVDADKSVYAQFTGPPTAPRWEESRVIANYQSHDMTLGPNISVMSEWDSVRNDKGLNFLPELFYGKGRAPARDLTGIRQWGLHNAEVQASYFLQDLEECTLA